MFAARLPVKPVKGNWIENWKTPTVFIDLFTDFISRSAVAHCVCSGTRKPAMKVMSSSIAAVSKTATSI